MPLGISVNSIVYHHSELPGRFVIKMPFPDGATGDGEERMVGDGVPATGDGVYRMVGLGVESDDSDSVPVSELAPELS